MSWAVICSFTCVTLFKLFPYDRSAEQALAYSLSGGERSFNSLASAGKTDGAPDLMEDLI